MDPEACAIVGGRCYTELLDVTADLGALDSPGRWVVVVPFDGAPTCARFARSVAAGERSTAGRPWSGVPVDGWRSSLSREDHRKAVVSIRDSIAAGDVYQVNLCRVLSTAAPNEYDVLALADVLDRGNPAPHAAAVRIPSTGVHVASASPELFLRRRGTTVESRPIKGTVAPGKPFSAKDEAENVMIVDLVRNDLGRVCEYGSIEVTSLLARERHPGLDHLVSTVGGQLRSGVGWAELLAATFPPGSVTGAPKEAALHVIKRLEPVPRGVYCGAIGWTDGDGGNGELNVAIRTFWVEDEALRFGTGGAITWDSTPDGEWAETELKASRLIGLASGGAR